MQRFKLIPDASGNYDITGIDWTIESPQRPQIWIFATHDFMVYFEKGSTLNSLKHIKKVIDRLFAH